MNSLVQFVPTVLKRVLYVIETPLMYLFGRDIFISYSRADAANYAQQLAIAVRGEVPQLSFFLDQWASLAGTTLPLSLRLALRWSQLLVFVGTQNAIDSSHVRMELEAFFNRKGRFVPINVGGVLDQAIRNDKFLSAVCGSGAVPEVSEKVANGTPSKNVVTRVVNAVTFTRQDRRLRRAVVGTTLGVIAVIGTGYFITQSMIANAQQRERQANEQADEAKKQQLKARQEADEATLAASNAQADQIIAQTMAKQARAEAKLAETARLGAERLRDQARAEAAKQGEIAMSRQRANQSAVMLRRSPDRVAESTSLAVESMSRSHAIGVRSFESDSALRASLSLLPKLLHSSRIEDKIGAAALSPDGQMAAYAEASLSDDAPGNLLRIHKVETNEQTTTVPFKGPLVAISKDARRVSMSDGRSVHTRDVSSGGTWAPIIVEGGYSVNAMALSPNGKYNVLTLRDPQKHEGASVVEVWEVETARRIAKLDTDGPLYAESVAFNPDGSLVAVGGLGVRPTDEKDVGRALVWEIVSPPDGVLTAASFGRPGQLGGDEMLVVAPGIDNRYLATASEKTAVVWKKMSGAGYREIARMPMPDKIHRLAFSGDGHRLTVLSGSTCTKWHPTCWSVARTLKIWQSVGYSGAFTAFTEDQVENIVFEPGSESFRTVSKGHTEFRVLNPKTGAELKKWTINYGQELLHMISASPDGRYVATSDQQGRWYVHDVISGTRMDVAPLPSAGVRLQPRLSTDGSLLTFIREEGGGNTDSLFVYRRQRASYGLPQTFRLDGNVSMFEIDSDNNYAVILSSQKRIQLRDLRDGRERTPKQLKALHDIESFRVTSDGRHLAVVFGRGGIKSISVWRIDFDEPVAILRGAGPISTYSVDGSNGHVMVHFDRDAIKVLRISTGKIHTFEPNGVTSAIAFSPDGKLMAVADFTGLLRVFDVTTGNEAAQFQTEGVVSKLRFSADGKYLASATFTERSAFTPEHERWGLRVWLMQPTDLIDEACERLANFSLSDAQMSYCKVPGRINRDRSVLRATHR